MNSVKNAGCKGLLVKSIPVNRLCVNTIKLSKAMPQLNEYSIKELTMLHEALGSTMVNPKDTERTSILLLWSIRLTDAIADREFTDSQLPFRTPKEIEQDERINNAKFI
jgi:hypothetical protein